MTPLEIATLLLSIIELITKKGLPALDGIAELIKKYGGAEKIPIDAWLTMLNSHKKGYFDVVDKPTS